MPSFSPALSSKSGIILGKRLVPPFTVSDLAKRLPILLALADGLNWVAKGKDRKNLDLLGNAQHGIDLLETMEADPVRANTLCPGGQDHGLDGSTPIGDRKWALLHANNNREWGLGDIPTWRC